MELPPRSPTRRRNSPDVLQYGEIGLDVANPGRYAGLLQPAQQAGGAPQGWHILASVAAFAHGVEQGMVGREIGLVVLVKPSSAHDFSGFIPV